MINEKVFNMGLPVGAGGTMQLPQSSTALHVAAWCGQSDIVRWLLNHGANPQAHDGMHQLPIEVASTLDVKRALGAAETTVELSDKVEKMNLRATSDVAALGDIFAVRLERINAELGEIDHKIEVSARECAREEVLQLRAALARKLARELKRFERQGAKMETDPAVWKELDKIKALREQLSSLHHEVDDLRDKLAGDDPHNEVEASVAPVGAAAHELRALRKLADKNTALLRTKSKAIEDLESDNKQLSARLDALEQKAGCCVIS